MFVTAVCFLFLLKLINILRGGLQLPRGGFQEGFWDGNEKFAEIRAGSLSRVVTPRALVLEPEEFENTGFSLSCRRKHFVKGVF